MVRRLCREYRRRRQLLRHLLDGRGLDVGGAKPSPSGFARPEAGGSRMSRRSLRGSRRSTQGKDEHNNRLVFNEASHHRRPRLCAFGSAHCGLTTECVWRPSTWPKGRHNVQKNRTITTYTRTPLLLPKLPSMLPLQRYVQDLISFVRTQQNSWSGREDSDTDFGVSLAVDVITTLQGKDTQAGAKAGKSNGEPMWLKLKWGMAVASRALDVWSARVNNCTVDMVNERSRRCFHERVTLQKRKRGMSSWGHRSCTQGKRDGGCSGVDPIRTGYQPSLLLCS